MTTFHIVSLFPKAFDSYLGESILKRAIDDKKVRVKFYNPRDFVKNRWHRVDQRPYGGGPGMVIEALPVIRAIESALKSASKSKARSQKSKLKVKIIFFSPSGKQFMNTYADKASKTCSDIILVCGRYEGIDARVKKAFKMDDISVGPFVLTGGELPAMLVIDSVARRIPGVLGDIGSLEESRIASPDVYTRPEVFEYRGKKYPGAKDLAFRPSGKD